MIMLVSSYLVGVIHHAGKGTEGEEN
jgi:hypothetical protein